jgi:transcription-repair coupling factor (superfamily II helicase)
MQNTAVAHGQMRERDLEKIMSDFYHRKHHILICTTIIETGIDIPSANTILIDRADKLGLAQLHQIRGRVGRSHHQAYAYLFTPRDAKITSDAQKRLEAICSLENLGAGFTLASHDMEIRGTGNLLGEEQSGHIEAIGYSLYMELLNKAINALKNGEILDINQIDMKNCEVDLKVSALLPDDYIQDIHQRLVTYKRIASAKNDHELEGLKLEIRDRFGKIPDYVDNLFLVNSIKLKAEKLKIIKIDIGSQSGKIKFDEKPIINQAELINLIQRENKNYKLSANDTLSFFFPMEKVIEKYNTITNILNKLAP